MCSSMLLLRMMGGYCYFVRWSYGVPILHAFSEVESVDVSELRVFGLRGFWSSDISRDEHGASLLLASFASTCAVKPSLLCKIAGLRWTVGPLFG